MVQILKFSKKQDNNSLYTHAKKKNMQIKNWPKKAPPKFPEGNSGEAKKDLELEEN